MSCGIAFIASRRHGAGSPVCLRLRARPSCRSPRCPTDSSALPRDSKNERPEWLTAQVGKDLTHAIAALEALQASTAKSLARSQAGEGLAAVAHEADEQASSFKLSSMALHSIRTGTDLVIAR